MSRPTRLVSVLVGAALVLLAAACTPAPQLGVVAPQQARAPQWPLIGDPTVLAANGHYFVFGSNTNTQRVPVEIVDSLTQVYTFFPWIGLTKEAMPQKPAWAVAGNLWAPTVAHLGSYYVMYFAANRANPPNPANAQCIGRAFAIFPGGPYAPEAVPFSCGLDGTRGALDPSVFQAPDGSVYLYAAFSDTEAPIYVIPLDATGDAPRRPDGQAEYWGFPVLGKNYPWEGRFIENPSMVYDPSTGTYLLTYSAGDWFTASYSTGLARCSSPRGSCSSNPGGPWLASGNGRTGTGGLSFFSALDGSEKAVYASFAAGHEGTTAIRAGTVASVSMGVAPSLGLP